VDIQPHVVSGYLVNTPTHYFSWNDDRADYLLRNNDVGCVDSQDMYVCGSRIHVCPAQLELYHPIVCRLFACMINQRCLYRLIVANRDYTLSPMEGRTDHVCTLCRARHKVQLTGEESLHVYAAHSVLGCKVLRSP
jgi:hypothetical protein